MESDHRVFDRDRALFTELAQGAGHGFAGGAGHGCHLFVSEEERKTESSIDVLANLVGEFEEQAAEATGDGFGEGDAAGVLQGEAILLAEALNGAHLRFPVVAKEGQEAFAFDGTELRGSQGFGGDFVDAVGEGCIKAEDGTRPSDTNNHLAVLGASGGQFEVAAANEVETARVLALCKEGGLGRQTDGAGHEFEVRQDRASQRAEPAGPAIRACRAADRRLAIDTFLPSCGLHCNS